MGFFVGGGGGGGAGEGVFARDWHDRTQVSAHTCTCATHTHTHTPPGVLLYREDAGRPGSLSVRVEPTAVVDRAQRSLISRLDSRDYVYRH